MGSDGTSDLTALRPKPGEISYHHPRVGPPVGGTWSIVIPLESLSADGQYATTWRAGSDGPEVVNTGIVLEFIELPATELKDLSGRSFTFPTNPEPGYIDGSVYLAAAHNPVDVSHIRFGDLRGASVDASLECDINFELELWNVPNQHLTIDTVLTQPTSESTGRGP